MTALTVFFTETTASTVATADTLLANPTTGATLSNKNTNLTSGTTGWIEVWSQGNASAQTGAGSQPAPTGHGWLLDSTLIEGNHFPTGTWTFSQPFETTTTGTFVADFHYQFYQRSSGGTYTLIDEAIASAQTIVSTSFTGITASVSAAASATFATGDKLYLHLTANITTNGTTGNLRMQASNSATLGSTSAQGVTPGYIAATTSSRTIPSTAALITTISRTITSTAALIATNSRTIPSTAALLTTNNRTIPATADIALTHSRTIPATACLDQPVSRTIPATAALLTTNSRTIPSTTALKTTNSRTVPSTAALMTTRSRTIPATATLNIEVVSGGVTLFANGAGTASFDHLVVTQYPDPRVDLTPVGRLAGSHIFWNETKPTNTTTAYAVSYDNGVTWTDVSGSNPNTLPTYFPQPDATIDSFDSDTSANYTNTHITGGANATWTYDTTNSRLTGSGGTNGLFVYTSLSRADGYVEVISNLCQNGGIVARMVDASNMYVLSMSDSSGTNAATLKKVVGGVTTQIGTASISFTQGTYHVIRLTVSGSTISTLFDGQSIISVTDTGVTSAGQFGMLAGTSSRFYSIRLQPLGDSLAGVKLCTKVTLTSSVPSGTPQVEDFTVVAHDETIGDGQIIPQLYDPTKPHMEYIAKELDNLAKLSSASGTDWHWYINTSGKLAFQHYYATSGAFCLQSTDLLYMTVTPAGSADLYRNQQGIGNTTGITDTQTEIKIADGTVSSWSMAYPLYSAPTIMVGGTLVNGTLTGGVVKTVGVQGVDTGRDFYWQSNSTSIGQDTSATIIAEGTLMSFSYVGQFPDQVLLNNLTEQVARALVETGTSGIVAAWEDGKQMLSSQATVYGNGLLTRFGNNSAIELTGTTRHQGLAPGMVSTAFLPEHKINDVPLIIIKVSTTGEQQADGTVFYRYQITATNGANLSNWSSVLGI